MAISPINNNFNPSFSGKFVKTVALQEYIKGLNAEEFDTFQKNYEIMTSIDDDKEYRYHIETNNGLDYGCITESGKYIGREVVGETTPNARNEKKRFREYENGLFNELFEKYTKADLKHKKSAFFNSLKII